MLNKKVTRWRNNFFHRKCKYCVYCEYQPIYNYYCKAKDKRIGQPWYGFGYKHDDEYWRICALYEVKDAYEESKVPDNSSSGESWSWEGHPGTGPSGRQ